MKTTLLRTLVLAGFAITLSGCPTCTVLPALFGKWTWTSDEFLHAAYILNLESDGGYGMAQLQCEGTCDVISVLDETGQWEACFTGSENRGELHTRADGEPKNFRFEWDDSTPYQIIDQDSLMFYVFTPEGDRIETIWTRSVAPA